MISTLIKRYYHSRLTAARTRVQAVQEKILLDLVRANRATPFGREHGFAGIRTLDQYRAAVPVRTSKEYAGYLRTVYETDPCHLTAERPLFFAMTAGSTGDYKYIPLTPSFKNAINRSVFAFYHFFESQCPELAHHPIQFLVGSAEGGTAPVGIPQGFVSGFNYRNLPAFIRRKFIIPYWVFTLENADDRYYAMARFLAANGQVAAIGAFSPMNIANIVSAVQARLPVFINDLERGALTIATAPPAPLNLPRQTELARQVSDWQRAGNDPVALTALLFPHLKYFACWLGGNMGHVRDNLFRIMGEKAVFEMPFSASEGVFAVPHKLNEPGGIAAVTSHFLEYIPEDAIDDPAAPTLCAWELEAGGTYYQVVSTQAGLYRYNMEDLIRVKDHWGGIPVVEFISKKARQISIANERLNENDVTEACRIACAQTGALLKQFILFPSRAGYYEMLVEGNIDNPQQFADTMEQTLCKVAKGYDFEREDRLLQPLRLLQAQDGQLSDYVHARQFRSALPSAQFKPIHLSNEFEGARDFAIQSSHVAADSYAGGLASQVSA